MQKESQRDDHSSAAQKPAGAPFLPGSMVVVTLGKLGDKFWGMILALARTGAPCPEVYSTKDTA